MMNTNRFKNPYFWIGLLGVIFTAMGIDINNIPSWDMLFNQIMEVFKSPSMLISVIAAITGVVINPNTPGLSDKDK